MGVSGKSLNQEEFVTCGGVRLGEVNFKTMESRLCPGLYFAGELLDIDGITGGFNFQAAWTTGWIAGRAMAGAGTFSVHRCFALIGLAYSSSQFFTLAVQVLTFDTLVPAARCKPSANPRPERGWPSRAPGAGLPKVYRTIPKGGRGISLQQQAIATSSTADRGKAEILKR